MSIQGADPFAGDLADASDGVATRPPQLPLFLALIVPPLTTLLAFYGSLSTAAASYVATLVLGTGALAWFRWEDGKRSKSPLYIGNRSLVRLSVIAAVVIVVCCGLSGFFLATELAK